MSKADHVDPAWSRFRINATNHKIQEKKNHTLKIRSKICVSVESKRNWNPYLVSSRGSCKKKKGSLYPQISIDRDNKSILFGSDKKKILLSFRPFTYTSIRIHNVLLMVHIEE